MFVIILHRFAGGVLLSHAVLCLAKRTSGRNQRNYLFSDTAHAQTVRLVGVT